MQREAWSNHLGLILAMVGGFVGMGNIWRFPYLMGVGGGAAFLIVYVIFLLILGIIGITYELTLGKIGKGGPITAVEASGMPKGKYIMGVPMLIYFIMTTYYMVVVGWFLKYFTISFTDIFATVDLPSYFTNFAFASPQRFLFHAITIAVSAGIMVLGVVKGFERFCKVAVPVLVILLITMAVKGLTLPGSAAGLQFLFAPDWSKLDFGIVMLALGQVFFSIGLCTTVIVLYGSYMKETHDIPLTAVITGFGDSIVAIIAALAIFPALFAFGITEPGSGPGLVFIMFPAVLAQMPRIFGIIFFTATVAVVLTSTTFMLELFAEPLIYRWNWSRKKAITVVALVVWACGLPAAYNFNWLSQIDLYFSTIFIPLAAILAPVALLWYIGPKKALEWVNKGASFRLGNWWVVLGRFVYPILIVLILVVGVLGMAGVI